MNSPQPPRVFLSYARADRARVAKLAEALTATGHQVWWDTAIEGGSDFSDDIARELDAADVVVVAWSASSVGSAWVRDEAGAGRDRKRLVPVQLDTTAPPLGFRQLQAIDLSSWRGRASDAKLAALVAAIARVAGSAPVAAPAAKPKSPLRFMPWLIAALVLVAALGAGWFLLGHKFGAAAKPIVAVLPFTDMSEVKGKAYFAEGLAEEILDTLAHDARLRVLGGTTARAIRDNSANPDFARDKLGVTRLLEGSVRGGSGADSVKVSVRLIDTADGSEIWSQTFDRSGTDLVAVQEEVAQAVAIQLAGPLGGNAAPVAASNAKVPAAAYEKVLVARQLLRTRQADSIAQARVLANEAVVLAPDYAPAYAVRAHSAALATMYLGLPFSAMPIAKRDAETAIRLDPNLSEAHTAMGFVLTQMNDLEAAILALNRAVTLKPDNTEARYWLGRTYVINGQTNQAIAQLEKAVASDPLWAKPVQNLVIAYTQGGRFQDARQVVRHYRAIAPNPADGDFVDSSLSLRSGELARGLLSANAALVRNPQMSNAQEARENALLSMFAHDRLTAAELTARSPYLPLAMAKQWRQVADLALKDGAATWNDPINLYYLAFALMQIDKPTELVRVFDGAFVNLDAYLAAPVAEPFGALTLASAFDSVERPAEARALRNFSRARMIRAEANGTAASVNAYNWARLLLSEGDHSGALTKLERGVNAAWWQVCDSPWIGDDKLLAPLNGDPRFEAVKGRCRAEINKQRKLAGFEPAVLK